MSVEERVPKDHPIRKLCVLVDTILKEMDALLGSRYAPDGRERVGDEPVVEGVEGPAEEAGGDGGLVPRRRNGRGVSRARFAFLLD